MLKTREMLKMLKMLKVSGKIGGVVGSDLSRNF